MAASYQRSVFINCPFDEGYAPLLHAIVFAVVDCGFAPRCALERSHASEIRIQKIYRVIGECALGIHDLARTQLDVRTQLPRFNMPLELGIFLGAKFLGEGEQRQKACLVFDEQPYRYQMYLSDVAGQDIKRAVKSISTTDADPFVVLGKGASGLTYIQAILEADSEWTVEYQGGHLDQHFRTLENLRTEEVIRLLISYAEAEESWREAADWKLVEV